MFGKKKKSARKVVGDGSLSITSICESIRAKFGSESIMLPDEDVIRDVPVVSTGSVKVDRALGIGGLPQGRIVEILGPESSGKTTIALCTVANAQRDGLKAAIVDTEHSLDLQYARTLGVNTKELLLSQPDSGEQALSIVEELIRTGSIGVVVVDSVAALVPQAEIEGNMGDSHVGQQARLMSQAMRKLVGIVRKTNALLIFTNQIRQKIGVLFGSNETTSGGNALKFYASVRLDIRRISQAKEGGSCDVKVKVVKNKLAPPFKIALTSIVFGKGFDFGAELLDEAVAVGAIQKRGHTYLYEDQTLGTSKGSAAQYLAANRSFADQLYEYIKKDPIKEKLKRLYGKLKGCSDAKKKSKLQKLITKYEGIQNGQASSGTEEEGPEA
jgi:recombination protein RecA